MKRWPGPMLLLLAVIFFWQRPEEGPVVSQAPSSGVSPALVPQAAPVPPVPTLVMRPTRAPAAIPRPPAQAAAIQLAPHLQSVDTTRAGMEQNGRKWRFVEGVRAVLADDPRLARVERLSQRAGFWIIAEADVPAGMESMGLVEREDNGLMGIFTGTLKAMGNKRLKGSGQFLSECPAQIEESYPQINSYLLRSADADGAHDLRDCLVSTGLFKRVEWEILDRPHLAR